ncbi:hypothetical protein [Streptantibioticus silvisoli]|uniref:Uncharacterized protein n=1 Tax=Streptantibioticus silvisoli TaxID=2705255 RepID=A0ABT6W4I8_9ACTN|nr:hypothetical protein [Streptantibioticus silvisoli]MDI5965670.1 hypothetical protein [Streptantibioticus silvisoli]
MGVVALALQGEQGVLVDAEQVGDLGEDVRGQGSRRGKRPIPVALVDS